MAMTKKHYEMVAHQLSDTRRVNAQLAFGPQAEAVRVYVAEALADEFAADNPNFDRAKFLKACGVDQ